MKANIQTLRDYCEPLTQKYIFQNSEIRVEGFLNRRLRVRTAFPFHCEQARIVQDLSALGVKTEALQFVPEVQAYSEATPEIRNIIAVASGKGGVGKSTVAVNLALALQKQGAKVGILDADLYGPSVALMLGGAQKPEIKDKIHPVLRHGLQSLSMADLLEKPDDAVIWRGPLLNQTLIKMLRDVAWHDLDYLILDLPPTTGDIPLTLAQQCPVAGAVLVTTPPEIALADVRKLKTMLDKVAVPLLGLVENMVHFCCPHCQQESALFGTGAVEAFAAQHALPILARLPFETRQNQEALDLPIILAEPSANISRHYEMLALRLMAHLASQGSASLPQIHMPKGRNQNEH